MPSSGTTWNSFFPFQYQSSPLAGLCWIQCGWSSSVYALDRALGPFY
jgi:hypothetical protein